VPAALQQECQQHHNTGHTHDCILTKIEQSGIIKARAEVTETEFNQYAEMVVAMSQLSSGGNGDKSCNTT
jgi:hypothetical protein